ncbi:uncharacterized protein N7483_000052 [Penicillium malachiteum]|uniref:uncharacterized protein n=1 Tax=Penicillium malachiteum TaxID=1324776 RepID=UPI002547BB1B|nr:uncharacterized protein N7483_000052 [Penicillium malachiteum]KAJ5734927.1 hypothetical protein N7483_000052 [Penicillium malachiteum]
MALTPGSTRCPQYLQFAVDLADDALSCFDWALRGSSSCNFARKLSPAYGVETSGMGTEYSANMQILNAVHL